MTDPKPRRNNLYTLSYFRKRLFDSGISTKVLVRNFAPTDHRYWTISVYDKEALFCTCFRVGDSYWFEFSDGGQVLKNTRVVSTSSMNVIIDNLKEWTT